MKNSEINLILYNNIYIKVETDNYEFLSGLYEYFSEFVDGYQYSPKYQAGVWDGRISVFNRVKKILPFGLLFDVIKYVKKYQYTIKISNELKEKFISNDIKISNKNLIWPLRDYQEDVVSTCLKTKNCIFRVCTSGGKTYILYSIWNSAYKEKEIKRLVVVVPNKNLIEQFHNDWIEYGIKPKMIGKVYGSKKEWDKKVVIATWQTLSRNHKKLSQYDAVFIDECHGGKAHQLSQILQKMDVKWRIGCTGTMPETRLDELNVKSFIGPVVREYSAHELKERGFISDCNINMVEIHYDKSYNGKYNEVKNEIFNNTNRLKLISDIIKHEDTTSLILVDKVEKEGEILENYLKSQPELMNYEIVFVSGRDKVEIREHWRNKCQDTSCKIILIATYPLFQQGINIPNLKNVILGSSSKSKIRILQSIGRALRKHISKISGSKIWDICDIVKAVENHSMKREQFYSLEKFTIKKYKFTENSNFIKEFKN